MRSNFFEPVKPEIIILGGTTWFWSTALAKHIKPKAIPGEMTNDTISPTMGMRPNKNMAVQYASRVRIQTNGCFLKIS